MEEHKYFTDITFDMSVATSNTHFQDSILKSLALKAGYATQAIKFDNIMKSIK